MEVSITGDYEDVMEAKNFTEAQIIVEEILLLLDVKQYHFELRLK